MTTQTLPLQSLVDDEVKTPLTAAPVGRRHALVETPTPLIPPDGLYCLPVSPVRHLTRSRVGQQLPHSKTYTKGAVGRANLRCVYFSPRTCTEGAINSQEGTLIQSRFATWSSVV